MSEPILCQYRTRGAAGNVIDLIILGRHSCTVQAKLLLAGEYTHTTSQQLVEKKIAGLRQYDDQFLSPQNDHENLHDRDVAELCSLSIGRIKKILFIARVRLVTSLAFPLLLAAFTLGLTVVEILRRYGISLS